MVLEIFFSHTAVFPQRFLLVLIESNVRNQIISVPDITHARRKFYEALPADEEIKKHPELMKDLNESTNCLISKGNTLH